MFAGMQQDPACETIAAIATAPGPAGIAVVRLSGPDSLTLADRLVRTRGPALSARPGGSFLYGTCVDGAGAALDEVIALVYRRPHSNTREDAVELQCHGGRAAAHRILRAALEAGARPAEPGEFTRRAFLNGRLDLVQAEAAADLIRAASDRAAAAAVEQLQGRISNSITLAYQALTAAAADLAATLDFDADELPPDALDAIGTHLQQARREISTLLATWQDGRLLREGARVVISGPPNVGKSSLFNAIMGSDRAIVTEVPGTTRDTIEETLLLHGVPVHLTDTAGLRDTACTIERQGIGRAQASIRQADLILHVITPEQPVEPSTPPVDGSTPARRLLVLNKADLLPAASSPAQSSERRTHSPDAEPIHCSALTGFGIETLRQAIADKLGVTDVPAHAAISERHRVLLQTAADLIEQAGPLLPDPAMHVPAAELLRGAMHHLGLVLGRSYTEDLLDQVFSRFCIGK